MTEFKQIIGRGTRIREDFGKMYFTILDFRNVTDLFADPDFDGDPVRIKEVTEEENISHIEEEEEKDNTPVIDVETGEQVKVESSSVRYPPNDSRTEAGERAPKVYVNGVDVSVLISRELYFKADGTPITVSLKDYTKEISKSFCFFKRFSD
jgi:type I restriction enzyme R subunit